MNPNSLYKEWDWGCVCWKYNAIPEKYTLLLHGRLWIQVLPQIVAIRHKAEFQEKLFGKREKNSRVSTFCPFSITRQFKIIEKPSLKLETEFPSRCMTNPLGRVISHSLPKRFLNWLHFVPVSLHYTQKSMNSQRLSVVIFIRNNWSMSFNEGIQ